METRRYRVGDATIACVVESQNPGIPARSFFPEATDEQVARHAWVIPEFADPRGRIVMSVQAFVVELGGRVVVVDPCVGNGKQRALPFWNEQTWPFLERFAAAGFAPGRVDAVVHTHLHADHVGWDTRLEGGAWVPTFARARHLYTARELAWAKRTGNPGNAGVWDDSIAPILAAGLADVVDEDADLGGGLRLEPTPGHTPGHVSLWVESRGERALLTGDFVHHPVQCAEPHWAEVGDEDADVARATRRRLFARAAESGVLVLGTHFASRPGGRIRADGAVWRFVPESGG
jgi:glyoxylase-like metal-dependent hydrolase (beta-lactamase superfamily II)